MKESGFFEEIEFAEEYGGGGRRQRRRAVRERDENEGMKQKRLSFFSQNTFFFFAAHLFLLPAVSSSPPYHPKMTAKKGHFTTFVHAHPPFASMCVLLSLFFVEFFGSGFFSWTNANRGKKIKAQRLVSFPLSLSPSLRKTPKPLLQDQGSDHQGGHGKRRKRQEEEQERETAD